MLVWGLSLVGFGLTSLLPLALVLLALAGFGDLISETLRSALLQHGTPDALRGRVSSLWMVQATVSPALGNAAVGFLAELNGARFAVVTGGLVCVVATLGVAAGFPALRAARLGVAPPSEGAAPSEGVESSPAEGAGR
ncbi:MFS transporter [Streptomyces formicae]|uniref:Multidrug efflux pump Tap n=1 Tax=Streptomyces formicae TaxID=1616117 RepID=A0A291QEG0_9ACTN|nr:MFS transporter [Streptomyces formicae]ATL30089.1 putative MFS transporter [Streptomyces formicae]